MLVTDEESDTEQDTERENEGWRERDRLRERDREVQLERAEAQLQRTSWINSTRLWREEYA